MFAGETVIQNTYAFSRGKTLHHTWYVNSDASTTTQTLRSACLGCAFRNASSSSWPCWPLKFYMEPHWSILDQSCHSCCWSAWLTGSHTPDSTERLVKILPFKLSTTGIRAFPFLNFTIVCRKIWTCHPRRCCHVGKDWRIIGFDNHSQTFFLNMTISVAFCNTLYSGPCSKVFSLKPLLEIVELN